MARLALGSEYDIGQKLISVKAIKVTALSGTPTIAAVIAIRESSWCYEHRTDPQPGGIIDADEPLEAQDRSGFNLTDQRYFDVRLSGIGARGQNQKGDGSLAELSP